MKLIDANPDWRRPAAYWVCVVVCLVGVYHLAEREPAGGLALWAYTAALLLTPILVIAVGVATVQFVAGIIVGAKTRQAPERTVKAMKLSMPDVRGRRVALWWALLVIQVLLLVVMPTDPDGTLVGPPPGPWRKVFALSVFTTPILSVVTLVLTAEFVAGRVARAIRRRRRAPGGDPPAAPRDDATP